MEATGRTLVLIGIIVNLLVQTSSGQWVQTDGPCGGSFESVAINGSVLYTNVFGRGVFRTEDEGKTWTAMNDGLMERNILSLASVGNDLIAGAELSGILVYSGSTGRWTRLESKAGYAYERIFHMTARGDDVWVATGDGLVKLYKKDDTWVDSLILPLYSSNDVAFTDKHIFFSARNILVRSADNGVSWDTCTTGLPLSPIISMIMIDDTLGFICNENGVYGTTNSGDSWSIIKGGIGTGIRDFTARNDTILCLYANKVGISVDRGTTWTNFAAESTLDDLKELGLIGNSLFLATAQSIFKSSFSDRKWVDISDGVVSGNVATMLRVSGTIFAGCNANGKIYRSDNDGANWVISDDGFHPLSTVRSLAYFDSVLFAGCDYQGLMQSVDSGHSWMECDFASDIVLSLHEMGGKLLLGHAVNGIMSLDAGGTSFSTEPKETNNGLEREISDCNCTTPYPTIPSFTTLDGTVFASIVNHGVYASTETDTGITWVPTNNGLTDTIVKTLYATNGILLAGTQDNGIFRSTDKGASWSSCETDLSGKPVLAFAAYGTVAFAGTEDGVLYSTDSGVTWNNSGTEFNKSVQSLLVDGEYLLAGTATSGIWRRPLREFPSGVKCPQMEDAVKNAFVSIQNRGSSLSCRFTLARAEWVTITLYNLQGKMIELLESSRFSSGKHVIESNLRKYKAGYYIIRFQGETINRSTSLIVSR